MIRIIIIVEGQTELSFCQKLLQPYFNEEDIFLYPELIEKSKGGIVHWSNIKKQIENHLKSDNNIFVTTFIDFYGIGNKHDFPGWGKAKEIKEKKTRVEFIEDAMNMDINETWRFRFLPYLQLHEFEGLLFSDIDAYRELYDDEDFVDFKLLENTINSFENPEMINDGKDTAPSKRLKGKIFKRYDKISDGILIAETIGVEKIRSQCSRFDAWMKKISELKVYNH